MSVWATLFMVCDVTDEMGKPHAPIVTRAIKLPEYLPVGTELHLKNSVDDPFSPDVVTIEQYSYHENDNQPYLHVLEVQKDENRITEGGFAEMVRDGGWGLFHW